MNSKPGYFTVEVITSSSKRRSLVQACQKEFKSSASKARTSEC